MARRTSVALAVASLAVVPILPAADIVVNFPVEGSTNAILEAALQTLVDPIRSKEVLMVRLAIAPTARAPRQETEPMPTSELPFVARERQVTTGHHGHVLTNIAVFSPDSRWIVYDVRSDAAGSSFDGTRIERAHVETGDVQVLYRSPGEACCAVATCSPVDDRIVFIHGPERPTADWKYAAYHRRGVIVDAERPGTAVNLDARDLTPPYTPGALRGGTHVHVFSGDGELVSFTYEDHVLADRPSGADGGERNQRGVGVSVSRRPVSVTLDHPRNHDGSHFSVLVTRTVEQPRPGSNEIARAFSDAWVGRAGYRRADSTWQRRAIAFQGEVVTADGATIAEVFIADLPDTLEEWMHASEDGPLEGTETRRPRPPRRVVQRRLTFTADRPYPGLQGPRHWLRSSPDGGRIAFLMRDDAGVVQLWTVSPEGGTPDQVTSNPHDIASAFTWSPDGRHVAHVMDHSVCVTDMASGRTHRLTARSNAANSPRPEACVFSPDGRRIAYVRRVAAEEGECNQVFVVELSEP